MGSGSKDGNREEGVQDRRGSQEIDLSTTLLSQKVTKERKAERLKV